MLNHSNFRLGQ